MIKSDKKSSKVNTKCPNCYSKFKTEYGDSFSTAKCPSCYYVFGITSKGRPYKAAPFYKKYQDVVAFGTDEETGKEVAVTSKGKRIDPSDTRYDLKKDDHGWEATGKKVRGKVRR